MEIGSHLVGSGLKEYRKEVSWREIMNYAAAVGDNNPRYFDDERVDGIIAHPMFCVAVTWPVTEKLEEFIESRLLPAEISATKVHYTEHIEFHRPVKPGDLLTVKGKVAAVLPHRAGTHIVIRYDVFDQREIPVFTEHIGAMLRGVNCPDEGMQSETLPSVPACSTQDRPVWEAKITIDPMRSFIYDGCTNIFFPIHTSRQFAKMVGLPGIILQGTATLAYAVKELINREASENPGCLKSLSCRFTGMVIPGTEIRIQLIEKLDRDNGKELHFTVTNSEGRRAISNGYVLMKNLSS
ncbi:MAG: MaoC family dehydratase N-terminal domain-containing protein [Proteobacteria bacterium]|nr:MaoC family dehydratase N-terminal domain-containing protein [Pseudomonadota bacterium]